MRNRPSPYRPSWRAEEASPEVTAAYTDRYGSPMPKTKAIIEVTKANGATLALTGYTARVNRDGSLTIVQDVLRLDGKTSNRTFAKGAWLDYELTRYPEQPKCCATGAMCQ